MRRIWLIFAQAVTVCLAILFVVVTLRPDWLARPDKQSVSGGQLEQIVAHGYVKRGWLGIEPQDMTADLAKAFGLERPAGVIIAGLLRDGPGAKGGLRVGDIVQTLDGSPVGDTPKLMARIAAKEPGDKIELGVYRNGKVQNLSVVAGKRPVRPQ